jgi:hypothetical protein
MNFTMSTAVMYDPRPKEDVSRDRYPQYPAMMLTPCVSTPNIKMLVRSRTQYPLK